MKFGEHLLWKKLKMEGYEQKGQQKNLVTYGEREIRIRFK